VVSALGSTLYGGLGFVHYFVHPSIVVVRTYETIGGLTSTIEFIVGARPPQAPIHWAVSSHSPA
jgi:hypothetical protein